MSVSVADSGSNAVFERQVDLAVPPGRVFDFHRDPANLRHLNPPGVRVLRVEQDGVPGPGTRISVTVRMFGWMTEEWRVAIVEWEEGRRFVDVAEAGPFAVWRHEHRMEPVPGGTRLTDRVEFRPRGPGFLAALGVLTWRPRLAFLFWWRHRITRRLLERGCHRSGQ